jgi:transcriptional regulator with PAS, ATPase and Fis domain/tetratricopeptide (TPR) repeat protein
MGSWQEALDARKAKLRDKLDPADRAQIQLELGLAYTQRGNHEQALVHLNAARSLFDQQADQRRVAQTEAVIGEACGTKGEADRARVYLDRALAVAEEIGDLDLKARALSRMADHAYREMALDRARELWTRARSHFEEHWDGAELSRANAGLGLVTAALGQITDADLLVARAVEDAQAAGDAFCLGRAQIARATVYWHAGDAKRAKRFFRRAMALFQSEGMRRELAEAYLRFGLFMGEAGNDLGDGFADPPAYWLAKAQELFRELGGLHDLERVREAFRNYGRRATDKVAEVEVLQLLQDLKQNRMTVQRESQRLADLVEHALAGTVPDDRGPRVEPASGAAQQGETRARIRAVEQTLLRNLDEMALAEERFLGAVNAVVLERENIHTLLELTRSLSRLDDYARLPREIAKMAAQLCNADRAAVAVIEGTGDVRFLGTVRLEEADAVGETWQHAITEAIGRGAPAQLLYRGARAGEDGATPGGRERDGDRDDARDGKLSLGYGLIVPMRHGEDLFGAVYLDKELCGGVFSERELDLAAVFAGQAAVILENGQIQEELRLAARASTATLEAIRDGVVSFAADGAVTSRNAAAAPVLSGGGARAPATHLAQMPYLEILRPCLSEGEEFDGRAVNLPSGDYLCSTRVIRTDAREVAGVVATFTELKRATSLAQRIVGSTARYSFGDILGSSPALKRRLVLAEAAARSDSNVLITGESGTGKELVAQAIHNAGPRATGPFVGINCAAIPRELLESELFGYEPGAFTGARRGGRPGKFELAEGGTILLDEIGDMPLEMQAKLLRVLQERVTQRLGGTREIPLNCRVVATTNRDLNMEAARGLFRQDLFFRLRVIHIDLPPLRERPEDVALLCEHFLQVFSARLGKQVQTLAQPVMDALMLYPWPGNIRELEHVLEGEVNLADPHVRRLIDVPIVIEQALRTVQPAPIMPMRTFEAPTAPRGANSVAMFHGAAAFMHGQQPVKSMSESERDLLVQALSAHRGNIPRVARTLGVSRGTVYNKMRKFNIDPTSYRE